MLNALDFNHHNAEHGVPMALLLRNYKFDFCGIKATEGLSYQDPAFKANLTQANALGIPAVVYMYAHPELPYAPQVDFLTKTVANAASAFVKTLVIGYAVDLERGTTQTVTNTWAAGAGDRLRAQHPGCKIGVYMGTTYAATGTGANLAKHFDWWWVAEYPSNSTSTQWPSKFTPRLKGNTTGWAAPLIWQYSQTFAGIYDANVANGTLTDLFGGEMPLTQDDAVLVAQAVWAMKLPAVDPKDVTVVNGVATPNVHAASLYVTHTDAKATVLLVDAGEGETDIESIRAAIAAIAPTAGSYTLTLTPAPPATPPVTP